MRSDKTDGYDADYERYPLLPLLIVVVYAIAVGLAVASIVAMVR